MAVSGIQPFIKVLDSNGDPIVGAVLKVYEAGTTTYRNIYSDANLSFPLTNPLSGANASNASGDFPRFYMAQGTYKLRAETSSVSLIWEYDNIDTGLSAGAGALPISAGGTGATTAAAARANLDVPSNSELADLASDIATLSSSVQNIVSAPQGRLTLTTSVPVLAVGVTAATAVYYTRYVGNLIPIYDGVQFNARAMGDADLTLTLNSNHVANAIYDVFIYWDATLGVQIATGVAWNTTTAGAGARGTGAGTTELVQVNGLWVNKYALSFRNGATTGIIAATQGTFVGSLFMDGTNGQITCHTAWGQSRKWGVWNAYNRKQITLLVGDSNASWTYSSTTVHPSNGTTANSLSTFSGLPEEQVAASFAQTVTGGSATGTTQVIAKWRFGVGWNSTTAISGQVATPGIRIDGSGIDILLDTTATANYTATPNLGVNVATCLEAGVSLNNANITWNGTQTNMTLQAVWWG